MTTTDFMILFLIFCNIFLIIYCSVIFFRLYRKDRKNKEDNMGNANPAEKTESGVQHLMEDSKDLTGTDYLADFMLQSPEEEWEDYKSLFFKPIFSKNKSGFTISTETLTMLRNVLRGTNSKVTLTAYIENILLDHLKSHQHLINKIADRQKCEKTLTL